MRAAAVALVLIVGAAVVLWLGNTLNSWVLGGLIGGLAALLLSIPISLTLFSFLSRRHDDRLRAEMQEEISLAQSYDDYEMLPEQAYEADGYMLGQEDDEEYTEEQYRRMPASRRLPAASDYPRLPAAGQGQAASSAFQHSALYPPVHGQQPKAPPVARGGKGTAAQRPYPPNQRTPYPGLPANQGKSLRSQHLTAALRAARLEAAQQHDDVEVSPTMPPSSRKLPVARPPTSLVPQPRRQVQKPSPSRQAPQQAPNHYRPRHVVDAEARQSEARRPSPTRGERATGQHSQADHSRPVDPETDQLRNRNRQTTGSMRRQPQTGQIARRPQANQSYRNPERTSGSLKNPLVRRAPYMYEDDPLREELNQQIDGPIMRRSSLYDAAYNEDEEE